jgi:hypothetical protein
MPRGVDAADGPMDVTTSGLNKRVREDAVAVPVREVVCDNWDDDLHEEEEQVPVEQLRTDNERYATRFQKLLMDVAKYEAACSRLSQSLEAAPTNMDLRDTLAGSQSMLQSTKIAMHNIYKSVEDNCYLLQESVSFYIPYDDDAWH